MRVFLINFSVMFLLLLHNNSVKADAYCGQTLTENLTLKSDLYCGDDGVGYAFKVETDGIIIDLNGYELLGDEGVDGILVNKANHVEITGNRGRIKGFKRGISIVDSYLVKVNDIFFSDMAEVAVFANQLTALTVYVSIRNNIFYGAKSDVVFEGRGTGGYSQIENNTFYEVNNSILLSGSEYNSVSANVFWRVLNRGIDVSESNNNYIANNRFFHMINYGIYIDSGSDNVIDGNRMQSGNTGIAIVLDDLDGSDVCPELEPAQFNVIRRNSVFNFSKGLYIEGGEFDWPCGEVSYNQAHENKLYDNRIGIDIGYAPSLNDFTGNAFQGTRIAVRDRSDGTNAY